MFTGIFEKKKLVQWNKMWMFFKTPISKIIEPRFSVSGCMKIKVIKVKFLIITKQIVHE